MLDAGRVQNSPSFVFVVLLMLKMNQPRPQVIVIAGPNGAGKSTVAPFLLRYRFGVMNYVNADTVASGLSAFAPENFALEAGRIMLKQLHDMAARQINFAFESTLASRSYAPWLGRFQAGVRISSILFVVTKSGNCDSTRSGACANGRTPHSRRGDSQAL
jgi:predicted ABC-type ATPase